MLPGGLSKGRTLDMSDDPFVRENATLTPRDDGQRDWGRQPHCNQCRPQYGGQVRPSSQSLPAVRAVNLEDPRGDCPDSADDSNLEDGAGDGGFDPNDYEGVVSHCPPPLLPCSHCTLKQPILRITMNSRSSGAIPVTRLDTSHGTVLSA